MALSDIDHRRSQNVVRTSVTHSAIASCATFLLLPHFDNLRPHLSFSYRFRPPTLQRRSREMPHVSVCSPFWILTVGWSSAWSCLFDDVTVFSPSTLENSVFEKHRFQIAPLWRTFSNGSVFNDRFRCCSVHDNRIWRETAPFPFENGLVWTGPMSIQLMYLSYNWLGGINTGFPM